MEYRTPFYKLNVLFYEGLVIMKKILAAAVGLAAAYTVIPTVFIRSTSYGIVQNNGMPGVMLTFDDGPNPAYTPQLLDLLKQYEIKAIFFVVAEKAERYPEIIKRMQQEGHVIGLHHYTHKNSYRLSPIGLYKEVAHAKEVVENLTQSKVALYRPTYGHISIATLPVSRKLNLTPVMWTGIFGDWKIRTCQTTLLQKLHAKRQDGATYVLHDCGQNPGADDTAPAYMLHQLSQFLHQATLEGQQFTDPKAWLEKNGH